MLLETLIVVTCINQQGGCSEATSAYYQQSKELQQFSSDMTKVSKELLVDNEWLVYVASPLYAVATRKPVKFIAYKGTVISIDTFEPKLFVQWNY